LDRNRWPICSGMGGRFETESVAGLVRNLHSVCMATHNGEKFIRRQLETILAQLAPDDEMVISDDSSDDGTLEIICSFADPRIRLFTGNTFFNPIFNFENALRQARKEIIVLADQDDIWLDGKVAVIRERFAQAPTGPYLIALDGYVVDETEQVISEAIFTWLNVGTGFWRNIYQNSYVGCCLAFSRELLTAALPFPRRIPMHDMWLGQLCALVGTTEFVPVKTIKYRKHLDSLTEFYLSLQPWLLIKRRFFLITHLLARSLWYRLRGLSQVPPGPFTDDLRQDGPVCPDAEQRADRP
jgi:glycosyltransferase involved in cell wall biosynthesis